MKTWENKPRTVLLYVHNFRSIVNVYSYEIARALHNLYSIDIEIKKSFFRGHRIRETKYVYECVCISKDRTESV